MRRHAGSRADVNYSAVISGLEEKAMSGEDVSMPEAHTLSRISGPLLYELFASANRIRTRWKKDWVDLCSIVNARSGACPEDCAFCAQSSRNRTDSPTYPLLSENEILRKASEARGGGARRFCVVTSGRKATKKDLKKIAAVISKIRGMGLLPCATLGLLDREELRLLLEAGLERYHHNLETSERFFPRICSTHTYGDKLATIGHTKSLGISLCSGGIFGMGETWEDRIDLAFALREVDPDSVPINFLSPIEGTRLGTRPYLTALEALKIISIYRFILPRKEIRVCGGRLQTLGEMNTFIFFAGADGLLVGNYLTTLGRSFVHDLTLIEKSGLKPHP